MGAALARLAPEPDPGLRPPRQRADACWRRPRPLAIDNLAAIAAVDGVDGVFFGPADLSASMDMVSPHPDVQRVLLDGIATTAAGKAGILMADPRWRQYLDAGAFVAIGVDTIAVRAASG
jgi:4-hydroxy-2-oxoheptanedioate aldolase